MVPGLSRTCIVQSIAISHGETITETTHSNEMQKGRMVEGERGRTDGETKAYRKNGRGRER